MDKIHLVLCGERGVGKSTLVRRVLEETGLRATGFYTKSIPGKETGFNDIFIHPAEEKDEDRIHTEENQIGSCNRVIHIIHPEVFDDKGVKALSNTEDCDIIVMDELGFMEKDAKRFQNSVLKLLRGDIPVIAVIKPRTDQPFLNRIRQMEKVEVIPVYEREREAVYEYLMRRIKEIKPLTKEQETLIENIYVKNGLRKSEKRPLSKAAGLRLSSDITASYDQPEKDRSMRDGYAVRSADITQASKEKPVELPVAGRNCAGENDILTLNRGYALRIMTGAVIPEGADCVVMQEDCGLSEDGKVSFYSSCEPGKYIEVKGNVFRKGDVILNKGCRIGPYEAMQIASAGLNEVDVYAPPRVTVISTGSELIEPGTQKKEDQLYESHRSYLTARMADLGINILQEDTQITRDDLKTIVDSIKQQVCNGADIVITTGGLCNGDKDLIEEALELSGAKKLAKIEGRGKGETALFSTLGSTIIWSLSGNPACAVKTFESVVVRTL